MGLAVFAGKQPALSYDIAAFRQVQLEFGQRGVSLLK